MALNTLYNLVGRVYSYIPLTLRNTIWRSLDKQGKNILDLGCGAGEPMRFINRHKQFYCVGMDIFEPWLKQSKQLGIYDDYVLCDIRRLPIKSKSFDIVFCSEVLEHLTKEDGYRLLKEMEKIAKKQVILTTPVGEFPQHPKPGHNPYGGHRSSWKPYEMISYGYKVRGYGLPIVGGTHGLLGHLPEPLMSIRRLIWIVATLITYFVPKLACNMICVKELKREG